MTTGTCWSLAKSGKRCYPPVLPFLTCITRLYVCGVRSAGTRQVWAWGGNRWGQLGLGDYSNRNAPSRVLAIATHYVRKEQGVFDRKRGHAANVSSNARLMNELTSHKARTVRVYWTIQLWNNSRMTQSFEYTAFSS